MFVGSPCKLLKDRDLLRATQKADENLIGIVTA